MASIFSRIIAGELPAFKIAENEDYFAFLDIRPMAKGHTLVVPKKEVDYFFDQDEKELMNFMPFCKRVASAIEKVVQCQRVGVVVYGLEVPHAHVHLIPINSMHDMDFQKPALDTPKEDMSAMAEQIAKHFV